MQPSQGLSNLIESSKASVTTEEEMAQFSNRQSPINIIRTTAEMNEIEKGNWDMKVYIRIYSLPTYKGRYGKVCVQIRNFLQNKTTVA